MESTVTITEEAPVAEGVLEEANAITKNDRDRITPITGNRLRVHRSQAVGSRQKFGCQPIKLEL